MSAVELNVIRYNNRTKAISDLDGNIYATIRTTKKRSGQLTYEVKGYSTLAGRHSDLEGVYDARGEDEAINAARELATRVTQQEVNK